MIARTTLAIGDDVLVAAKVIARQQHSSVGSVVSELARRALRRLQAPTSRNGIPLLPLSSRDAVITMEAVNALRDEPA